MVKTLAGLLNVGAVYIECQVNGKMGNSDLGGNPWSFVEYDMGEWAGGSDKSDWLVSWGCLSAVSDMGNSDLGVTGTYLNPIRPKRICSMRQIACTSKRAVTNMVGGSGSGVCSGRK
jgi:hypothetical protein